MRYAKPGAVLACARAVIADTKTVVGARATEITMREHILQLQDLIDETRRMVEASWETVKRCPTL